MRIVARIGNTAGNYTCMCILNHLISRTISFLKISPEETDGPLTNNHASPGERGFRYPPPRTGMENSLPVRLICLVPVTSPVRSHRNRSRDAKLPEFSRNRPPAGDFPETQSAYAAALRQYYSRYGQNIFCRPCR